MTKNEAEALQYVKKFISDTEAPDLGLKKALEILVGIVDSTHSGPYGCTFLACNKTFGNKDDWERHENSAHFWPEMWRCDEEKPASGVCVKLCYQRQRFEDHLKTEHHMKDNGVIEKIETRRISRDCQARFWCGFCIKLIDLKKKGLDAWKERFDHIDNHFMGCDGFNKQSISDWIPVGSDKPEGKIQIPLSLHASADSASSSGISSDSTMRGDGDGSGQAGSCMHFSNSLQI